MGTADPYDLPVYLLAALSSDVRHCLLAPARRWRAIVDVVEHIEHDVLLDAVVRIRAAGEKSTIKISDLLQIPYELVEHLQMRASSKQITMTPTGQLQASATTTAWVYRDVITEEMWPEAVPERPPVQVHYKGRHRGTFPQGTAGRPIRIDCFRLAGDDRSVSDPSAIELARFGRTSTAAHHRTSIVSDGENCLVVGTLKGTAEGPVVERSVGVLHAGLTQYLARHVSESPDIVRWLDGLPFASGSGTVSLPLRDAADRLAAALALWRDDQGDATAQALLAHTELALKRYCDQAWYAAGAEPHRPADMPNAAQLGKALGFPPALEIAAKMLLDAEPDSLADCVLTLVLRPSVGDTASADSSRLAGITARWLLLFSGADDMGRIGQLTKDALELCGELLSASEKTHGR